MRFTFPFLILFGLFIVSSAIAIEKQVLEKTTLIPRSPIPTTPKYPSCKRPRKATPKHNRDITPSTAHLSKYSSIDLSKRDPSPADTLKTRRPRPKNVEQNHDGEITTATSPDGMSMDVCGCTAVFVWTNDGHLFGAHVVDGNMAPVRIMIQKIRAKKHRYVVAVKIETPNLVDNDAEAAKVELRTLTNARLDTEMYEYEVYGGWRFTAKANAPGVTARS